MGCVSMTIRVGIILHLDGPWLVYDNLTLARDAVGPSTPTTRGMADPCATVMAGPVPAIHGFTGHEKAVDAWDKPRHDESIFPPIGIKQRQRYPLAH